jgi:hypothetical protein
LLALRKAQIKAIRERARDMTRASIIRAWAHDAIRLTQRIYNAEHRSELDALGLIITPPLHQDGAMQCVRCHESPRGFRTKECAAIFQLTGICQHCQDAKGLNA